MGTQMTDTARPLCLEPEARGILSEAVQPWLGGGALGALVLLAPVGADERERILEAVEGLVRASVRRSDRVVRCGAVCCALVLPGADEEGARSVVRRLGAQWGSKQQAVRVGLAGWTAAGGDLEGLLGQACHLRLRLGGGRGGKEERAAVGERPRRRSAAGQRAGVGPGEPVVRALELGVPYLTPPATIPPSVRQLVPPEVMAQLRCLPVGRERKVLTVALADPTDREVVRQLEQLTGMTIFPVMTDPEAFQALARPAHAPSCSPALPPADRTSR